MTGVLVLVAMAAMTGCLEVDDEPPAVGSSTEPILNGADVAWDDYPWVAEIWDGKLLWDKPFCTGMLIAPSWVLSAAHCVDNADYVKLAGTQVDIVDRIVHPHWFPGSPIDGSDDLALFELEHKVSIEPMPLSRDHGVAASGQWVSTLGWGRTSVNGDMSDTLQWGGFQVTALEDCQASFRYNDVTEAQLCVREASRALCMGDSGGPTTASTIAGDLLVGVTTAVFGQCTENAMNLLQRVSSYADWITGYVPDARFVSATALLVAVI